MTITSTGSLIDALRSFRLISSEQHQQLLGLVQGKTGDPRPLAKQLVQRGWLTVFQINQLFAGQGKDLAVGAYRVLDRLGQGGLSQVFKARHVENDLVVALKVIRPEALTNVEGRQQFLQEIEAMARLEHPNIVQFCDADQHEDTCYFAMEYVDGIDLGKHVRLSGPPSVRDACDYIRQAALGLQHAHERNLVHRDIKPVNLFLTQTPVGRVRAIAARPGQPRQRKQFRSLVKILDWGLAGIRNPRSAGPQILETLSKGMVGTADYLSPEQARNASTVDIRGDIYSLGCTFYYLLTGQPPFPEGTLMQKILKHQQAEPPPVDTFRSDVPPGVTALMRRMVAKNPDDRFQTPAALAMALMPFTRAGALTQLVAVQSSAKGTLSPTRKDDTPLPIALGGEPNQPVPRQSRSDPRRSADAGSDTACA
jgi:eukaryotic-like serine/threonine-protein kinase